MGFNVFGCEEPFMIWPTDCTWFWLWTMLFTWLRIIICSMSFSDLFILESIDFLTSNLGFIVFISSLVLPCKLVDSALKFYFSDLYCILIWARQLVKKLMLCAENLNFRKVAARKWFMTSWLSGIRKPFSMLVFKFERNCFSELSWKKL